MRKKKYMQCQNNSKFYVDVTYQRAKQEYDQSKVEDYPGQQGFGKMVLKENNFKELAFVNLADLHFFGDGFDYARAELAFKFIENVANAYVLLDGDIFDVATLTSKTNAHMSIMNNSDAIDLSMSDKYLDRIADKVIAGVGGNHDGIQADRLRDSGISPLRVALKKYGITYFDYNLLLNTRIGKNDYNILVTHAGRGNNPLDGGYKFAAEFAARNNIPVDVLMLGHSHIDASSVRSYQFKQYDEDGKLLGVFDHQLHVFIDPSFQGQNQFFLTKNKDKANTNAMVTVLSEEKNPYYKPGENNTENEYVLVAKRFPILNENTNSFSKPAIKYLAMMAENREKIMAEVKIIQESALIKEKIDSYSASISKFARSEINKAKKGGR